MNERNRRVKIFLVHERDGTLNEIGGTRENGVEDARIANALNLVDVICENVVKTERRLLLLKTGKHHR